MKNAHNGDGVVTVTISVTLTIRAPRGVLKGVSIVGDQDLDRTARDVRRPPRPARGP